MPKAIHPYEVLRRPVVTEKSTMLADHGKYVFEVAMGSNKFQIKEAVERAFNVQVTTVNTFHVRGQERRAGRRVGRASDWKKAIVTLRAGQRIELFEGV